MTVWDVIAQLTKRLEAAERRIANLVMTGTAEQNQGAKTKVRFDDAGHDGQPFQSPLISQANSSGHGGGGVSGFTKIGIGEPVLVFNPGGVIGEHSRVMPSGPVGDHPSPGTAEADGHVLTIGNMKFEGRDDYCRITVGDRQILMTGGKGYLT